MAIPAPKKPELTPKKRKRIAGVAIAAGVGLFLVVSLLSGNLSRSGGSKVSKLIVGKHDAIYYSPPVTKADAMALESTLKALGFFTDRGSDVTLAKGANGAIVSFAAKGAAWDKRDEILAFEEIGRRIAVPLGGYPIKVRLIDEKGILKREITVGRLEPFGKDEVYYLGAATLPEADIMARKLITGLFLTGSGATVLLSKEDTTTLSFVVFGDTWQKPEALPAFEEMTRNVASTIGGLPISLRLLNPQMETLKEVVVDR